MFESALERYNTNIDHTQAFISDSLAAKLQNTPKSLWSSQIVRVIITYDASSFRVKQTLRFSYDGQFLEKLPIAYITTSLSKVSELYNLPGIKSIYLDRYYQFLDPSWKNLDAQVLTYPSEAYVGARALLDLGIDGSGIKIAIVDTGIDSSHPDLDDFDNNPATNDPKVIAEASFIDYDFDGVNDTGVMDEFGHGTHCAGIAAANGTLKGIAPGA
ncbi:MAG: S8 family serine peptidase, partial [Candidatus Heimdallarchaeaceae archaeon]